MRKLFVILTIAFALASCAEEEIPFNTIETPGYHVRMEMYGHDSKFTIFIDSTLLSYENLDTLIFDTTLFETQKIFLSVYDDLPDTGYYSASLIIDDILITDSVVYNTDTIHNFYISIGPYYYE